MLRSLLLLICSTSLALADDPPPSKEKPEFQYKTEGIEIKLPQPDVPRVKAFGVESVKAAVRYMDQGALTWVREKSCINCHTTGPYLVERPALLKLLGPLEKEVWDNFATDIPKNKKVAQQLKDGIPHYRAHQPVWRALGLAEWDKHLVGKLSPETHLALEDMLRRQSANGSFVIHGEVEIPYITTDYELSVQAARAIAAAPGWLASLNDEQKKQVAALKRYLRYGVTRNDYDRVLKLEVASRMPNVIPQQDVDLALKMLTERQHSDGGWSLRDFSSVEGWSLKVSQVVRDVIAAVPDAADPGSDAYMTALAVVLLRESGVAKDDPRVKRGVQWLKQEQREPGWWWMDSLYRGNYRYITYIATAKALTALAACDELPSILEAE
jgi:squalene-hopene/tetraprenyl-beta-curcumene cyclase